MKTIYKLFYIAMIVFILSWIGFEVSTDNLQYLFKSFWIMSIMVLAIGNMTMKRGY